jgi:hypothetical protein
MINGYVPAGNKNEQCIQAHPMHSIIEFQSLIMRDKL